MSTTPRSRTPSRVGTPVPGGSPSRLVLAPPLRPTHSLTNLRVYSKSSSSGASSSSHSTSPSTTPIAISAVNTPPPGNAEGILVTEAEAEPDVEESEAIGIGRVASPAGDEDSKKNLRDHLRQTLSYRQSTADMASRPPKKKSKTLNLNELPHELVDSFTPRQYFVLTEADSTDSDDSASAYALMQALISIFLDDNNDKLRCINAGATRITFLLRPPLYYVCISDWGEPEGVTRNHLEYLHLQILSVVTASHLRKMFERRRNSDLGRLLGGAENILNSLLHRLEWDLALSTSSLHCLKLDTGLRARLADALVPSSKAKDVLYVILVANGQVVTLVRPKKHSIHPADLHILVNTIYAPSILTSPAAVSWLPICLPKFNPNGFVNAYVNFLVRGRGDEDEPGQNTASSAEEASSPTAREGPAPAQSAPGKEEESGGRGKDIDIGLVCISGGPDFETVRTWCDSVIKKMGSDGALDALITAVRTGATVYSVSELGIPGLRHFVYKSRSHVQITAPVFEDPYDVKREQQRCVHASHYSLLPCLTAAAAAGRLITLYQTLHDAIHARSGQAGSLKLQYIKTQKESVMGWITQPFELYVALSSRLPKSAVVGAANAVARWVKKEEGRLFLTNAPVF
ncbi:DUF254-domain-containing protein [Gloeophyllum trabeum ATCC 11539]|uniref:Vacuolar fusion protein MON1 n=1 Tax=Gloeophyllum trabeum (strain ATCC 11539 / FP-39264 / Madison 617) TaxID=670483 RepID=S7Q4X0_GLOTA|nr:DUF254-domain-containing protein [Gloeophyllum trabeum ATCC 11539]EPQ54568.1 DUF254-domain-containing protein [Gloeophyllum trabeum ATCC 11539]